MRNKNSLKILIAVILTIILAFFIGTKYENNKIKGDIKNKYLNTLYFELLNSISSLEYIENEFTSNPKNDIEFYKIFLKSFSKIGYLNQNLNYHLSLDKEENSYLFNYKVNSLIEYMERGITLNGVLVFNSFLEDNMLSEKEKKFLKELSKDLESIRLSLYSEETGQENPKLSFKEISNAFKDFEKKYDIDNLKNLYLSN